MVKKFSNSLRQALLDPSAPTLAANQHVARLAASHGKSHFTVTLADGRQSLATLHAKLKSTLWIHRGTFVVFEAAPASEQDESSSASSSGLIVGVLTKEQIKAMKKDGSWPSEFALEEEVRVIRGASTASVSESESESGNDSIDESIDSIVERVD